MGILDRIRRFLYQGFIPVTKSLILLSGIVFFGGLIFKEIYNYLVLIPDTVFQLPWTLITYPLVNPEPLSLIFALLWFWFVGGSLERSWGSWNYGLFALLVTLTTGVLMTAAGIFLGVEVVVRDFWLPLVALTWAWAGIFPDREVLLWGIIPLRAQWLAWITAAIVFFSYIHPHWLLGFASISGILVVYFFRGSGPFSRGVRYWAWSHGLSGWLDNRRQKARRKRLKVIKH
ncbi:MAG: DUF1751 domain-containing protein [Bacillota bacterium]